MSKKEKIDIEKLFDRYEPAVLERFKKYHKLNPTVYSEFKKLAFKMKNSGRPRYSARTIMEVMRWHYDISTVGSEFKLTDTFTPIYVRLLIHNHPEFLDFFSLKG